jgi:hypothetical protein
MAENGTIITTSLPPVDSAERSPEFTGAASYTLDAERAGADQVGGAYSSSTTGSTTAPPAGGGGNFQVEPDKLTYLSREFTQIADDFKGITQICENNPPPPDGSPPIAFYVQTAIKYLADRFLEDAKEGERKFRLLAEKVGQTADAYRATDENAVNELGPSPEETSPEKAGPEKAGPEETSPEKAGPEKAGPEETSPEKAGPEETSPEKAGPEKAGPEETSPEKAPPHPDPLAVAQQELAWRDRRDAAVNLVDSRLQEHEALYGNVLDLQSDIRGEEVQAGYDRWATDRDLPVGRSLRDEYEALERNTEAYRDRLESLDNIPRTTTDHAQIQAMENLVNKTHAEIVDATNTLREQAAIGSRTFNAYSIGGEVGNDHGSTDD